MRDIRYFDAHLHLRGPDQQGLDDFLERLSREPGCIGGNLILNTEAEADVVLGRRADVPPWIQLIPSLRLFGSNPVAFPCGWVKIHPVLHRVGVEDVQAVCEAVRQHAGQIQGIIVHCFPWGSDLAFQSSLPLVAALARALPDTWILATHGGGYESWSFRAHVGGCRNVLFDFSASLAYYSGSDLLRPLQRYLTHSADRVVFGTDWPSAGFDEQWGEMVAWADKAGLTAEQLESTLLANSRRIWPKWIERT